MAEQKLTAAEASTLSSIEKELNEIGPFPEAGGIEEFCKFYQSVRPLLEKVVELFKKIPFLKKVAEIIEFLMKIANAVCPI